MDHDRSNPGMIGRNRPSQSTEPEYHRAYKACIPCRNKKAKCRITAEEYASGLPCAKCRREMRPCTYTVARHGPRRPRQSMSQNQDVQREIGNTETHTDVISIEDVSPPGISMENSLHETVQGRVSTSPNDTLMTTVVSNGNDALNLLFKAAQREEDNDHNSHISPTVDGSSLDTTAAPLLSILSTNPTALPDLSSELMDTWNAYRFVRMGWLSASETVWLLDMFFKNIAPLTPILGQFYADRSNHFMLVTQEPMLLCMILLISSRYHTLPTIGGHSRGYLIHHRLWEHCQHLLMRLVLGLEKYSKAKTRTLGTIEALLLLTEWHPRALYAPPPSDGWDSDILFTAKDRRDQNGSTVDNPSRTRWREEVIEPSNRSDRMCWMVLSCALSLGNELGVFDERDGNSGTGTDLSQQESRVTEQKAWLAKLLYVYQEQLSSRLGRRSMMTLSNSHSAIYSNYSDVARSTPGRVWMPYVTAWTRLTKIVRSISDLLFPSPETTSQIIRSGRYINMTEHIQTLLSAWSKEHQTILSSKSHSADLLILEYESTRMHTYSLGLQAILFRTLAESDGTISSPSTFDLTPTDFAHVQEVINSTLTTLKIAIQLFDQDALQYCSIRTFLHITTASIFLLKGLGLGVNPNRLRGALDILKQVIVALKSSNPDDLHLGGRYALLLEMHMARVQENFVPSNRPQNITPPDIGPPYAMDGLGDGHFDLMDCMDTASTDILDNDWLSFPLDSSLTSLGLDSFQGLQCLGDGTLDFIWNLGA